MLHAAHGFKQGAKNRKLCSLMPHSQPLLTFKQHGGRVPCLEQRKEKASPKAGVFQHDIVKSDI